MAVFAWQLGLSASYELFQQTKTQLNKEYEIALTCRRKHYELNIALILSLQKKKKII
jgi:hypothetical protein